MSITSGQIVKPPFLRQYLIFFQYFLYIRDPISIITSTEKSKFEENADLKVYGNIQTIISGGSFF